MFELIFPYNYQKQEKNFFKKHKDLKQKYYKTLELLMTNPYHPSLRLHKLNPPLENFYSISLNMKYKIIIDFVIKNNQIILLKIDIHDKAYK